MVMLPPAARARLEQEAALADIDLSSLVRLKLTSEVRVQLPQYGAA